MTFLVLIHNHTNNNQDPVIMKNKIEPWTGVSPAAAHTAASEHPAKRAPPPPSWQTRTCASTNTVEHAPLVGNKIRAPIETREPNGNIFFAFKLLFNFI